MPRKVLILGSTGSIGEQALEVVACSEELELCGISAGHRWERLCEQAREHGVAQMALSRPDAAEAASKELGAEVRVLSGDAGVRDLVAATEPDLVLNAIVGFAGLGPTIVTLSEGIDLALANKESLIVGGELVMALAEAGGSQLVPVDSEHSALHQLLRGEAPGTVDRLVLTASGGPFRGRADLSDVTPREALAHPTWEMGGRITVDSATLMNKGFEVIEAHHLFGYPYEEIEVVVHPQSIVHALVRLNDGASLAHMGHPDMRVPISYALHLPERMDVDAPGLDLASVGELRFEAPDTDLFPCLSLAREAGVAAGTAPCVLNAADEVAVEAFLAGRLPFTGIAEVVADTLGAHDPRPPVHFEELHAVDAAARAHAGALVERVGAAR
jgi:1-deoxy-D-xylulose-5-phosphate reductoisomerase